MFFLIILKEMVHQSHVITFIHYRIDLGLFPREFFYVDDVKLHVDLHISFKIVRKISE